MFVCARACVCFMSVFFGVFFGGEGKFESLIVFYGEKAVGPNPNRRTDSNLNPYSPSGAWRVFFSGWIALVFGSSQTPLPGLGVEVNCNKSD